MDNLVYCSLIVEILIIVLIPLWVRKVSSRVEHIAAISGIAVKREVRPAKLFHDEFLDEMRALGTPNIHIHDVEVIAARVLKRIN